MTQERKEDDSGTPTADAVALFLEQLDFQKKETAQRVIELHALMTEVGELSEAFIPHLQNYHEVDEYPSHLEIDLYPEGETAESWGNEDPIAGVRRDTMPDYGYLEIYLDLEQFGSYSRAVVTHDPDFDKGVGDALIDAQDIEWGPYTRNFLNINWSTEPHIAKQIEELRRNNSGRPYSTNTSYYFDQYGRYVKTCFLPPEVEDDRSAISVNATMKRTTALRDMDLVPSGFRPVKRVLSEMNEQDLAIVSTVLTCMKGTLATNLQRPDFQNPNS